MTHRMRVFDAVTGTPWLCTQESLQMILEIAARENLDPDAVAAQRGKPLDHTHRVTNRNGIAVIPVEGPIVRYADLFTEISGATSIETLAQDLHSALNDNTISGILLNIDSPGGEVNGTSEFADMVHAARDRKPIVAYVGDMGASAAYWIASAASEVVVNATARVGSIGVVAAIPDPSKQSAKHLTFVSSQSPNKRPDPTTEKGRGLLQTQIDSLAQVFVDTVARNRNVTPDAVLADFGQGGMFVGQEAVAAGLADRVGSFESVLAELANPATVPRYPPSRPGLSAGPPVESVPVPGADEQMPPVGEEQTAMAEDKDTQEDPRIAAMQVRLDALEASEAEARASAETANALVAKTAEQAQAAATQVEILKAEARRTELKAVAAEFINASTEEHVDFMEKLDPAALEFYVRQQKAAAAQDRVSPLYEEKGRAGTAKAGSATEQLNALVNARVKDAGISVRDASLQIANEHPDLAEAAKRATEVRV